jgi:hypothetical protein
MDNNFEYYYNNVPGDGLCRNNLIYTSLISKDKKTFCQWYFNDTDYHKGKNVVDPNIMDEKWEREVSFLTRMQNEQPQHVPKIKDIDHTNRKIYLEIDGPDFWERAGCLTENYDNVLPSWREQMLEIIKAHKSLGIYKYSMHPSSYFIMINIKSLLSHISDDRQRDLFLKMHYMGIDIDEPTPFTKIQMLAFESFKTNFPEDFMEEAKKIYA